MKLLDFVFSEQGGNSPYRRNEINIKHNTFFRLPLNFFSLFPLILPVMIFSLCLTVQGKPWWLELPMLPWNVQDFFQVLG